MGCANFELLQYVAAFHAQHHPSSEEAHADVLIVQPRKLELSIDVEVDGGRTNSNFGTPIGAR
ncbi:MAG: hypothetical protein ACKVQT_22995 [Burkholderiales bacterium]